MGLSAEEKAERRREASRRWREANPEKVREQGLRRATANPEKYRGATREASRRYRGANPEKAREAVRRWNALNAERNRQVSRAWNLANPEKRRDTVRRSQAKHFASVAATNAKYRASKRGATVGDKAAIKAVYRKAKSEQPIPCAYCGKQTRPGDRHVDHIVPISKPGTTHSADNLCIACVRCNLSKNDKTGEEFRCQR